ncbi:TIGR04104 family putative zinc finger protein [Jeotgalibacillus marinus]|uniref:TIGR04104 family putative zinc finger protein n=1 Tax=Jeotgalibacillus marinus TaxID=86667 RepID=A0ABV3Q788_9BACL
MPICQNCSYKWRWKEAFVKIFSFKRKLRCPSCESPQYISKKSRNLLSLFAFIPMLWLPLVSFSVSIGNILALEFVSYILVLILMPFLFKLSTNDEPMW